MKTKAEKDKAFAQRMRVWLHNGFLGRRKRAELFLINLINCDSVQPLAKAQAEHALNNIRLLEESLKKRIDP
jgi:hypothetical protein